MLLSYSSRFRLGYSYRAKYPLKLTSGYYKRFYHFEHKNTSKKQSGRKTVASGTYGESVLLVGRSGGWGELGGVGGRELQTVALHSSILGHVGDQGLQCHVLLLPQMVPCHHTAHKVHLCRKWKTLFFRPSQRIDHWQATVCLGKVWDDKFAKVLLDTNLNSCWYKVWDYTQWMKGEKATHSFYTEQKALEFAGFRPDISIILHWCIHCMLRSHYDHKVS